MPLPNTHPANHRSNPQVTTDPASKTAPVFEGAGVITSDSLAAESLNAGGGFSENPHAAAMKQPSASTTTNTTDTSAARVLPPAADAQSRADGPEAANQGHGQDGKDSAQYTTPGDERQKAYAEEDSEKREKGSRAEKHSDGNAAPAPSYVHASSAALHPEAMKPHGKNLHEVSEFDEGKPDDSLKGDVGDENDPGRVAEGKMLRANAQSAGGAKGSARQTGKGGDGSQYEVLDETSA